MNRILELKQKLGAAADKAKVLIETARGEKRNLTGEEQTGYDQIMADMNETRETIKRETSFAEVEHAINEQRGQESERTGMDPDEQRMAFARFARASRAARSQRPPSDAELRENAGNAQQFAAFRQFLRYGPGQMTQEERGLLGKSALDMIRRDMRGLGDLEERAAQSDVTGNLGAYTVPQGFYAELQVALKYYAGMLEVGPRLITTASGNDMPIPTTDDTANVGRRLAENLPVTNTAIPFGQKTFKAWKYSSDIILMPYELIQDTGIDLEAEIVQLLGIRIGRKYNSDLTSNADGAGPSGILTDVTTGATTATGVSGVPQYNDLVNLKYSVNRSYRMGAKWMMNDTTLAGVLQLTDKNNRPLILDYLTTLQEDEPEKLLGQPIVINNDLPNSGTAGSPVAGNQCILYGAWRNYWVRQVREFTLLRLVERYADNLQVGYIGFSRLDGRYIDAGQHPIKALVSATT